MTQPEADAEDFRPGESIVERRIRLAAERGEFSNLPGEGAPIEGLDDTYDPLWWVKRWAEREGVTAAEVARLINDWKKRD
ncbi:MAG: DUF1992 domain-containing protein [Acidimicrobiia bacterium]|nr:DUF1992 domain-containing protein [Acidimicrobiia bacterium]MBT8194686.1 DUF1992 domain-containing protein [Acidimicrobiia bacterium]NNF88219.1 DUF1992 domain-containing protein [Acidimicrobiia bacterium]NNL12643.1 DUF1992 domain-containing protein [Acidimicrobiia bacterium]NNL98423.1 DUF1992 domain-containing protein [Acidimicrobiia bacterium]